MEEDKNKQEISWHHPGGKLRRAGPAACSEAELLAIVLAQGSRGRSAEEIAQEILDKHGTLNDLMGLSLRELMEVQGLKDVKATQLAAVFEITRRIIKHLEQK